MNVSPSYHASNYQQGVGLIEVMIALLLLAVAVLGFTTMQMTAVKATDESLLRTRALTVMRGGAEMMRANPSGIAAFKNAINVTATSAASSVNGININSCMGVSTNCTIDQLATRDAITITQHAKDNNMKIAMLTCPNTGTTTIAATSTASATSVTGQERQCFVMSWGTTTATLNDTDTNACANANGTYKTGAKCFILEAY